MLEHKEKAINTLQSELEEAEKQHLIIIQAHIEDVDRKICTFYFSFTYWRKNKLIATTVVFGSKRVEEKFKHYEEQRKILLEISKTDAEEEKRRSDKSLQFLNAVLFATEENSKSIKQCITSKAKSRRSDTIHTVKIKYVNVENNDRES